MLKPLIKNKEAFKLFIKHCWKLTIQSLLQMSEDFENISSKTWARTKAPVVKIGYMDGAYDGQAAVFQQSFNVGYDQGISFGLELGVMDAMLSMQQQGGNSRESSPTDQQRLNCQICSNGLKAQENIGNLYNIQKEKNVEYLLRCNRDYKI